MDAKARRLLWNDIISLIKENRVVILTSHSMEECEALCTRLVIMVNGQFKCLGSPQHLKSKFGNGYKLSIRLNDDKDKHKLYKFMKRNFPTSKIQEKHRNLFEYVLPFSDTKLSDIFGRIESNRENLNVKDYSVSQTTLDQVFINFTKFQNEEPFMDTNTLNQIQVDNDDDDDDESEDSSTPASTSMASTPQTSSQLVDSAYTSNTFDKSLNDLANELDIDILPKKDQLEDESNTVEITRL